ncbi:MAG: hypothetical protein A2W34_08495 [Chloroflexi bacterium RBG_16_64_32]|nr:MAG: hypothetical protein A2W34_08495 [Chloroflexi bacterium RBG_16_64_32]
MSAAPFDKVEVLGIAVSRLSLEGLLEAVVRTVETPGCPPLLIAYANAHTCNLAMADRAFRQCLDDVDVVYVDGNGPRVAAWLAGHSLPHRLTGADWIDALSRLCVERPMSLYFVGAADGVAREAAERLALRHPGLVVLGSHPGYFDASEEQALIAEIRRARPDVLLVGMTSPAQERWMVEQAPRLGVPVVWCVGAIFDYASGRLRRAPRWMRRLGLEWLGRLLIEPRRLAVRYLIGLPLFFGRAVREGIERRLHPAAPGYQADGKS